MLFGHNFLTKSDIVRFMNADVSNRLGSLAKKTVKDLGFTVRRVKVEKRRTKKEIGTNRII